MTAPMTLDASFADLPNPAQHAAPTDLRAHTKCARDAMPGFRQRVPKGKIVANQTALARNCAHHPHTGTIIAHVTANLARGKTTPGAIQFAPANSLPAHLIRCLVDARLRELA